MSVTQNDPALSEALERHFAAETPARIGVAVSGGSDSLALLHLVAHWTRRNGGTVWAATVDHGLRPEAAQEAQFVARQCASLAVSHEVLTWQGWNGTGNLQAEARKARYALLGAWGAKHALDEILIGHTEDDQAENLLIRLSRKSGVDGLAAMASRFTRNDQVFGRPLLTVSRAHLRAFLKKAGIEWCEDASNADLKYDRVKAREAMLHLKPLGLDAATLSAVSLRLADARDALEVFTRQTAQRLCRVQSGDLLIDQGGFAESPSEIQHRLLGAALNWIGGGAYAPRGSAIAALRRAIAAGQAMTLAGCHISVQANTVRLTREYNAVKDMTSKTLQWDRWELAGDWQDGFCLRALGEDGLGQVPDWRNSGLPRHTLLASPSVWQGDSLIAAPLAGFSRGWKAKILPERENFRLLSA